MASTKTQLDSLADSLAKFQPRQPVEWPVGEIANALIEQAKVEPDSAVLKAMKPFKPGPNQAFITGIQAAGVRTIIKQAAEALPRRIAIG